MGRYTDYRETFDGRIHALQEKYCTSQSPSPHKLRRTKFTEKEDKKLVRFLASIPLLPQPRAKYKRAGNAIYQDVLVANVS